MKAVDVDKLDELGIGILRELRGSVGLTGEPVLGEDEVLVVMALSYGTPESGGGDGYIKTQCTAGGTPVAHSASQTELLDAASRGLHRFMERYLDGGATPQEVNMPELATAGSARRVVDEALGLPGADRETLPAGRVFGRGEETNEAGNKSGVDGMVRVRFECHGEVVEVAAETYPEVYDLLEWVQVSGTIRTRKIGRLIDEVEVVVNREIDRRAEAGEGGGSGTQEGPKEEG